MLVRVALHACSGADAEIEQEGQAPPELARIPIFRVSHPDGHERLETGASSRIDPPNAEETEIAFHAVIASDWPPGLIPIYASEAEHGTILDRRPKRGRENSTEPFFFALPPASETNVALLAGRWECEGTHADGAKDYFGWDLTVIGSNVVGRFDQNTDYRFAYVTGGTFESNRLELHIDYISNRYLVTGMLRNGELSGTWDQTTGADQGQWFGKRSTPAFTMPPEEGSVPLYEWTSKTNSSVRRYDRTSPQPESAWEHNPDVLCRVWPPQPQTTGDVN